MSAAAAAATTATTTTTTTTTTDIGNTSSDLSLGFQTKLDQKQGRVASNVNREKLRTGNEAYFKVLKKIAKDSSQDSKCPVLYSIRIHSRHKPDALSLLTS